MMQTSTDIVPPSPPITDFHVPLLEFYLPTTIFLIIIISAVVIAFREKRCCPSFWAIISAEIILLFCLWGILYLAVFGLIYEVKLFREGIEMTIGYVNFCYLCAGLALAVVLLILKVTETRIIPRLCVSKT